MKKKTPGDAWIDLAPEVDAEVARLARERKTTKSALVREAIRLLAEKEFGSAEVARIKKLCTKRRSRR